MGQQHQATAYLDYQQRAREFSVGDLAFPLAGGATDESQAGRVVAVWPGIGQVDLEFPWGPGRYSVEDLQRVTNVIAIPPSVENTTVPGGAGTVSVPGGPAKTAAEVLDRVAQAYVKSALYWAGKDRHYRGSKVECEDGKYICPKCKADEEGNPIFLRPANYKRSEGKSHRLLGCPTCLFLIKREDIIGDPDYLDDFADGSEDGLSDDWDETIEAGKKASIQDLGLDKHQIGFLETMAEKGKVSTVHMEQRDLTKFTKFGIAEMVGKAEMKLTAKGKKFLANRNKKAVG